MIGLGTIKELGDALPDHFLRFFVRLVLPFENIDGFATNQGTAELGQRFLEDREAMVPLLVAMLAFRAWHRLAGVFSGILVKVKV